MVKSNMIPSLEFSLIASSDLIERLFFFRDIKRSMLNFEYQLSSVILFFNLRFIDRL